MGESDFTDADFQRVLMQMRSDENIFNISVEEIVIIYNEIMHLRFNANNFCLSIPVDVE